MTMQLASARPAGVGLGTAVESRTMATPEETQRLLDAVRESTERAESKRREADVASALRREAVQAAMDAGIARSVIAESAGVHRNVLYQILKRP